jgi:hypothetical protein
MNFSSTYWWNRYWWSRYWLCALLFNLGYPWGHFQHPASRDKIGGIISLVRTQSDAAGPRQALIKHFDRGASLGRPVGFDDLKVDQQPIAVLHQRIARVAQLGFLARTLRVKRASGSVVDSWVALERRSPWKLTVG